MDLKKLPHAYVVQNINQTLTKTHVRCEFGQNNWFSGFDGKAGHGNNLKHFP